MNQLLFAVTYIMEILKDIFRQLSKSPGFTAIVIITLALCIGAGTAVFTVANAVLLRSLPVPNPQELRVLNWAGVDDRIGDLNADYAKRTGNRLVADSVPHPYFLRLRADVSELANVFGCFPLNDVITQASREAFVSRGLMVSDNFFSALGVNAFLGQVFVAGDDAAAEPNIVISYEYWERHFDQDPNVLGKTLTMQGDSYSVIGVLPRRFSGVHPGAPKEFYVSMSNGSPFLSSDLAGTQHWFVRMMARAKPGTSNTQLASALSVVFARDAGSIMNDPEILVKPGQGGLGFDSDTYGKPLMLMLGVVGLVIVVACANIAGLSLIRGSARQHELAIRSALGAGRKRLIFQSLSESAVLALTGGVLGVLLAMWGKTAISRLLAGPENGLQYDLSLNTTILSFTMITVFVTTLLSGLLPALKAGRVDPMHGLKNRKALDVPRLQTGRILVVAQICVSISLLASAGLYARSLVNLRNIDPGFDTGKLLVFELSPGSVGYDGDKLVSYYGRVENSLADIPGVQSAALTQFRLLDNRGSSGSFEFSSQAGPATGDLRAFRMTVSESFFSTMGINIMQGRGFDGSDSVTAPKVVVVNETFVRDFLSDVDAIGQTVTIYGDEWQIAGVCRDAKYHNLKAEIPPTTYFPINQRTDDEFRNYPLRSAGFAVRSDLPPTALANTVQQAVADVDPAVPVAKLTTQSLLLDGNISQERLFANLCGALAVLALFLCCIGLYGLMAYNVTRRTSEIAIRIAIGAQRGDVARSILREAFILAAIGIGIGLPAAFGLTQLIKSQLYDIQPSDPFTLTAVTIALIAVALLAAWFPTWRATRISPVEALRSE